MPRFYAARTASLIISLLGAVANLAFFVQVLSAPPLKWIPESEWESSSDPWKVNGVKFLWVLLSVYFAAATSVCTVGFVGIIKNKPSFVRFYRDYSIADFSFCTFFTVVGTYAAFRTSVRTGVCEELSRQPELMRDMVEMGLNLENCELWFERAVLAFMGAMIILVVIRLHFLIAVSNYYSQLLRRKQSGLPLHSDRSEDSLQRIYLLPTSPTGTRTSPSQDDVLVYAPVPLSTLSPREHATATEAWISRAEPASPHRHRHHNSTGRISLPVRPDEGLLPPYEAKPSRY